MAHEESFTAGPLSFVVKHELWDENIQDHADQGVAIMVKAQVAGKDTTLLRFNCFDVEKSYDYGPENRELAVAGPEMLGGSMLTNHYQMDPIACGNPIGWSIKTLGAKLRKDARPAPAATRRSPRPPTWRRCATCCPRSRFALARPMPPSATP